jgi:hypothetical protein
MTEARETISEFLSNPTNELQLKTFDFIQSNPIDSIPLMLDWVTNVHKEIPELIEHLWMSTLQLGYEIQRAVGLTVVEIAAFKLESVETQKDAIILLSNSYHSLFGLFIKEKDQKYWNLMNLMKQVIDSWFDHPNAGIQRSVILFLQNLITTQSVSNQKV